MNYIIIVIIISMVIFLYGPDSYRRREKLKEYLKRYRAKYKALSLSHFYLGQDNEWDKLKDFSQAQSLFEVSKLGIISEISGLEDKNQKELIKILKENLESKDLTLIIESDKKPAKEFNFLLKEPIIAHKFENLTGMESQKFLQAEIKKRNLVLDKESQNLLMVAYGGDAWGLVTELDKLSLLDEKKINKKILENHQDIFLPVNIYETINEMRNSKNTGNRLSLLEELLERSEGPRMIFNILVASPYQDQAEKEKAADYDVAVKSGKLEYEEALLDLCLESRK